MDPPGGPHKGPYKREAGGSGSEKRCDAEAEAGEGERLEDAALLPLKREEGATHQGTWATPEAGKGEEWVLPGASRGNQPC